jgi:hypothetical protein
LTSSFELALSEEFGSPPLKPCVQPLRAGTDVGGQLIVRLRRAREHPGGKGRLTQTRDGISGQSAYIREGISEVGGQIPVVCGRDELTTCHEGTLLQGARGLSVHDDPLEQALENYTRQRPMTGPSQIQIPVR